MRKITLKNPNTLEIIRAVYRLAKHGLEYIYFELVLCINMIDDQKTSHGFRGTGPILNTFDIEVQTRTV